MAGSAGVHIKVKILVLTRSECIAKVKELLLSAGSSFESHLALPWVDMDGGLVACFQIELYLLGATVDQSDGGQM